MMWGAFVQASGLTLPVLSATSHRIGLTALRNFETEAHQYLQVGVDEMSIDLLKYCGFN